MRMVEVGGVRVSAVGLGTWQFGSQEWGYGEEYATTEAGRIVRRALDLGVTFLDTAEVYGFGRSERILGEALGERRDEAFVASKIMPVLPLAPVVRNRAAGSARRLGTDRIDLYQVHQPNPLFPIGPLYGALRQLVEAGTVVHVGVSNHSLGQWCAADAALGRPVLANQVQYSLVSRGPEQDLLPWAQDQDRLIVAYSPLAQGYLSGRYDADHPPTGLRALDPRWLPENLTRAAELIGTLRQVAGAHDATPSQVALAWLLRRPNVMVIPGASSVAQLEANAAAADLDLTDEEDRALTAASDAFHPRSGLGALPAVVRRRLERR